MSTVYVDRREADIDVDGDRLVVRALGERRATVPLRLVERVVVAGSAQLTTRFIGRLGVLGIGLAVVGSRFDRRPVRLLGVGADAWLRIGQYEVCRDRTALLAIARPPVARKAANAAAFLETLRERKRGDSRIFAAAAAQLRDTAARLREGGSAASLGALLGSEGAAASTYFAAFATAFAPALRFDGRNRRPPRDPVNVCLSIGYTLLQLEALKATARVGLDPLIGVYHEIGRDATASPAIWSSRSAPKWTGSSTTSSLRAASAGRASRPAATSRCDSARRAARFSTAPTKNPPPGGSARR